MATTLTAVQLTVNASSTSVEAGASAQDGWTLACDDFSKLLVLGYNSDTAAVALSFNAASSGSLFVGKGQGDLSTSIASSEYRTFGPFESYRFKSTSNTLVINCTAAASTKVTLRAYLLP